MDIPSDQYRLYAEFGIASEKAQVLEVEAGNVALYYFRLSVKPDEINPEVTAFFKNIMNDVNKKTLGQLIKKIKTIINIDEITENLLNKALDKRNYLSHHFFRTHNYAIFSEQGRKNMMSELKEIQNVIDQAHSTLYAISSHLENIGPSFKKSEKTAESLKLAGKRVPI